MYLWSRTATIFKIEEKEFMKKFLATVKPPEVLELNPLEKGILHINFQWLEPLIIMGKRVRMDKLESDIIWFVEQDILVFLGHNYEYMVNLLQKRIGLQYEQVKVFEKYQSIIGKEKESFNVVNITVNLNANYDIDTEKLESYTVKQLVSENVIDKALPMLHSYLLETTEGEKYFRFENNNEVQFFDTDKDMEILDTLKTLVQNL